MSKIEKESNSNKMFFKIVDGGLKQKSKEGLPGAEKREWQVGGESGVVWEIPSKAASGLITNISFYEGDVDGRKFTSLNITLDENENGNIPVITAGIDTKYAQEILKKLPNVNFDEEVRIRPYSYLKEGNEKNTVGIEMTQKDAQGEFSVKVSDFFYDWDARKEKNGYPTPPKAKEDMTSKDWRRYFEDANEFVIEYVKTKVMPRFIDDAPIEKKEPHNSDPEAIDNSFDISDIPFD